MQKKNSKTLVSGLLAAVAVVALNPQPASAVTLMDLLRGGPAGPAANRPAGEVKPLFGSRSTTSTQMDEGASSDPDPLPKISGPRYHTYKPDTMRAVQTARFAAAATTDALTTGSTSTEGAGDPRAAMAEVKVFASDDIAKALEDYYGSGRPLIWISGTEVSPKARAAIDALAAVNDVGLEPGDYGVAMPDLAALSDPAARNAALMQFELALSAKALTYVQDTERGRIDPNRISGYYDFKRKTVNLKPVLNLLRLSPDVAAYLRHRDPDNSQFIALKAELAKLRAEDSNEAAITIAPGTLLKPGKDNAELANVIKAIQRKSSDALKVEHALTLSSYAGTPQYTPELVALVEAFQKESGLKPDGIVGQATIRKLVGDTNGEKIQKLIVAMEQRRWLPDDLSQRFVFINQPAFEAYYFNEGVEQIAMRVVVGSKANQTYFFQDQIQTVEFNPYWGVPQSIIVNEMLPKLRADPSYLDRLGYEVSHGGRKVASSQVNWNTNPTVDVRQPPGGGNALGELKIMFPNAHAIYMHDTPSKSFFQRDMRALSHGCVRLAEPRVMAAAVMGTTVAEIGKQIASGQNRAVSVPQKMPVYIAYFTAWPEKDGSIGYHADVYDRDTYAMKAFAATSAARAGRS